MQTSPAVVRPSVAPSASPAHIAAVAPAPAARFAPPWLGGLQDLAREHAFEPLRVSGTLPPELEGVLYRNGPGKFGVGGERFPHWFDGDGAVSAVRLEGGRAWGAHRLVRTAGLEREERAGRRLFGGYGTPLARPFRELLLGDAKQTANTSVLLWQGRLFATCEADKPYEVARGDLSTLGESTLEGALVGPFSAHPHDVLARHTTYGFGVAHGPRSRVDVYALPHAGAATRLTSFPLEGVRLCHDFAATDRHLVFAFAPHYLSLVDTLLLGKPPVTSAKWRAARGTEIVVVPIDEPTRIRRFRVEAFLMEHVVNAFEDGDEIVVDGTWYPDADGLEGFVGGLTAGRVDAPLRSELRRVRVHKTRDVVSTETLLARPVELPRVSPRVDAARHGVVYSVAFGPHEPFGPLLKADLASGRVEEYCAGPRQYPGEGVFVPRPGGSEEDDGWVLTMVYDADADRSRLEVLDARAFASGPVASCHFDHAVPFGFHGAFAARR